MRHVWHFSTQRYCVCFEQRGYRTFAEVYEVAQDGARVIGSATGFFYEPRQWVVHAAVIVAMENIIQEALGPLVSC